MDKYIVVDIESTGVKLSEDEIIEIGAVYIENGTPKDKFNTLIKPTTVLHLCPQFNISAHGSAFSVSCPSFSFYAHGLTTVSTV